MVSKMPKSFARKCLSVKTKGVPKASKFYSDTSCDQWNFLSGKTKGALKQQANPFKEGPFSTDHIGDLFDDMVTY